MSHSRALDKPVMDLIPEDVDGLLILDVAQGLGGWGYQIKMGKTGSPVLIGLDIWPPYVEKLNKLNIYDHLIICDARAPPLRARAAHIVLACEVLEHIPREDADVFLAEMGGLHRNRLIVSTPKGFMKQGSIDGNTHEAHVSAWTRRDLEEHGFKVNIVNVLSLPRTVMPLMRLRAFILRRKLTQLLVAWRDNSEAS